MGRWEASVVEDTDEGGVCGDGSGSGGRGVVVDGDRAEGANVVVVVGGCGCDDFVAGLWGVRVRVCEGVTRDLP